MSQKAWVVTVDMGYGHQRTADNLKQLAPESKIICANNYEGIPKKDLRLWNGSRSFYEAVSSFKKVPLLGNLVFSLFLDYFQKVPPFYPRRDLSEASLQVKQIYSFMANGWGRDLIERLKKNPLPLVSTFFTPAFMAEFFNYPGEIFCVVCDTDITRAWAPLNPSKSKIKYFAPTDRAADRLKSYGVRPENIFLTGYPLPIENLGSENQEVLKEDLRCRLARLDPHREFFKNYYPLVKEKLGGLPYSRPYPLTIMFAVGGAGAQKEIAIQILRSLAHDIEGGRANLILVAGTKKKVLDYFQKNITNLNLQVGRGVEILFSQDISGYFRDFNSALHRTDILWTKPSELSFYACLGLPIIIASTIGSHEDFNKRWLLKSGFGMLQKEPMLTNEWLFDLIDKGHLAEMAFEGFLEGESRGAFNIQKVLDTKCPGS